MSLQENTFFVERADKLNAVMTIASMGKLSRANKALDREFKLHKFREPGSGRESYAWHGLGQTIQFRHNPEFAKWSEFEGVLRSVREELPGLAAAAARQPSMRLRDLLAIGYHEMVPDLSLMARHLLVSLQFALFRPVSEG